MEVVLLNILKLLALYLHSDSVNTVQLQERHMAAVFDQKTCDLISTRLIENQKLPCFCDYSVFQQMYQGHIQGQTAKSRT